MNTKSKRYGSTMLAAGFGTEIKVAYIHQSDESSAGCVTVDSTSATGETNTLYLSALQARALSMALARVSEEVTAKNENSGV